jgi:hypothetical protein
MRPQVDSATESGPARLTSWNLLVVWLLFASAAIASIAVILNAESRQLGETGRVLAVTAALAFVGGSAMVFAWWARRRIANMELIRAWLRVASHQGPPSFSVVTGPEELLSPSLNLKLDRYDMNHAVFWLRWSQDRGLTVPADEAGRATCTLLRVEMRLRAGERGKQEL